MTITLKTPEEIEKMRVAGRLAAEVLEMITPYVKKGVSTEELDAICHKYIVEEQQAIPAPLNYHGYPKATCISVNHVVCHGIPSPDKKLKDGDILNIDITVIKDGYHGDTSKMFMIGNKVPVLAKRLCQVAQDALYAGMRQVKPGNTLYDIGLAIQQLAEKERFSVVEEFCGHGIGAVFHEDPQVLHYVKSRVHRLDAASRDLKKIVLEPGMTFTIEPMINAGKPHTKVLSDNWTAVTRDRSLSAQWEHTMVVTENGCEVFTHRNDDSIDRLMINA